MSHADRLANVRRSHSSEGDVDVAAFAVCARPKEVSYVSKLTTRLLWDGHAWLIANAQIFRFPLWLLLRYNNNDCKKSMLPMQRMRMGCGFWLED